ncbi:6-hydroxymethylpterin diphosphokinase MptE-like protein [Geobacillus subterraneus]|uniref:6-hydroxymethylpterin diphosphokinase MptE-like protein n=1 Tax=Geobacillus subterraneus TaxID=129338 RepID=UPI002AC9BF1D|nr:6-hydroxymethylpterin diphosphokinase MptE-like protein [Geobacillus subterraneus]WPZ18090.1 6-hydroxymethylpterin diphosphokinase MptE-like protein [Geobacillus subterraneus]
MMLLAENQQFLQTSYPTFWELWNQLKHKQIWKQHEVVPSYVGLPTVQIHVNGRPVYLHSKYNPEQEAERLAQQLKDKVEQHDHLFFYGIGLGYHVEKILSMFPDKVFTIYEPNPWIFFHFLSYKRMTEWPLHRLRYLYVETDEASRKRFFAQFANALETNVLLITLPSYERIFNDSFQQFVSQFRDLIQSKRINLATEWSFSKRWTLNSIMNLPTTLQSASIFSKKEYFCSRPVLLVAAGPSLQEEYDNLRYIKEKGLAYIFAVGSANRALVANGILPDAVCTYDPQAHNFTVFWNMIDKGIDANVPMIYGTSVGYETIQKYKGPKFYAITSQDTVTPYYLDSLDGSEIIDDAFSIAIITLQILAKMGASPVILVGQNFAFRDNYYYAKEIKRGEKQTAEVLEHERRGLMQVKDVYGHLVTTNESLNQMRLLMEHYIQRYSQIEVINTTKGGANIAGAPFIPLEKVIQNCLTKKVVEENWYMANNENNTMQMVVAKVNKMNRSLTHFIKLYEDILALLRELEREVARKKADKMNKVFARFDELFRHFTQNDFFNVYVRPVIRVYTEVLQKEAKAIWEEQDPIAKATKVIQSFGNYLHICQQAYNETVPLVKTYLHPALANNDKKVWKRYKGFSGEFQYSNQWEKKEIKIEKQEPMEPDIICTYYETSQPNATIKFRFKGTAIRIIGGKHVNCSTQIRIVIDGYKEKFSAKDKRFSVPFLPGFQQVLFEKTGLKDEIHEVEIELLNDGWFIFQGIELNADGRLMHVDEVTIIEELEVGKRIRCHYKASFNQAGVFSGLGEETAEFIPPESSAEPDGDFYFIMVDEENGKKKLIADRVVQHSISWEELNKVGYIFGTSVFFGNREGTIRSLKGGFAFRDSNGNISLTDKGLGAYPLDNEWDKYVLSINNDDVDIFNILSGKQSWCQENPMSGLEHPVFRYILSDENVNFNRVFRTKRHNGKGISYDLGSNLRDFRGFRPMLHC